MLARTRLGASRAQSQVGAAEGDDPWVGVGAGRHRQAIGPGSRADHRSGGARRTERVADRRPRAALSQRPHLAAAMDRAPAGDQVLAVGDGDGGEVDDAGIGRVQRRDPRGVGLDLAQPLAVDALQPGDAVRRAASIELVQPWQLGLLGGDDHLAVATRLDPAFGAVGVEPCRAIDAEPCLERAGLVVDPGVDHAAGVAALMACRPGLALEHRDLGSRVAEPQLACRRQPDDPGPDHADVDAARWPLAHRRNAR